VKKGELLSYTHLKPCQSNQAAAPPLESITDKELSPQDTEDDISDAPGLDSPQELDLWTSGSRHTSANTAHNILHFFEAMDRPGTKKKQNICKECK
jgi:hypothetical protein